MFTHSNVLCDLERSFSSVEVIINIEARATGDLLGDGYAPDVNLVKSTFSVTRIASRIALAL